MTRNSTSAWWRMRSGAERIRRFLDIVDMVNLSLNIYYKCGVMLILKGWYSPSTTTVVPHMTLSFLPRVFCAFMHPDMQFLKEIFVT